MKIGIRNCKNGLEMKPLKLFSKTIALLVIFVFTSFSFAYSQQVRTVKVIGTNHMRFTVTHKKPGLKVGKKVTGDNGKPQYRLKSIIAKPGQKMEVILHNYTKLPASAMSHDWVLLKKNANAAKVAKKSSKFAKDGYIAPSVENQIIAHTGMVAGGHMSSVTFTVPQKAGKYLYICTFPGHYTAGMKGYLIVK